MKQAVVRAGVARVVDVAAPSPVVGRVLVANRASVISSGTERTAVASGGGGGSLPVRAVRNPELVKKALDHLREHGLRETLDLARGVTAPDVALGYSSAGIVLDTGGVPQFRVGQMVACAGVGNANHAEVVSVPGQLVARVPDGVDPRAAAFTTLGSIAMQGFRRAEPTLGERIVVLGLGLLGLLTVQLFRAAGCPVIGIEPVAKRRELAVSLGAEAAVEPTDAADAVGAWTDGVGADAVVITAASTTNSIINDAIALLRPKGRVVPVGDVGLGLERAPLYRREADVLISTSYGPGRYDPTYEEAGVDYPIGYVRWTENRNMCEFLRLLSTGDVNVQPLIGLERPIAQAAQAYAAINSAEPPLAVLLTYPAEHAAVHGETIAVGTPTVAPGNTVRIALVGAGGFVTNVHVPSIKADGGASIVVVANRSGTSASDAARLAGGADTATDWRQVLDRDDVDLVLIGTRHDTHAEIATAALAAGKAVFVEKPLGLSRDEIDGVWNAASRNPRLAIGFNRPFSSLAEVLRRELRAVGDHPVHLVYRVSSPLAADHWLNDPAIGGGRLLGEACHMFDFANWLCGRPIRVYGAALPARAAIRTVETSSVTISYENGSMATVHYSGEGASRMPKERIEVLSAGRSWVLDDFISLTSYTHSDKHTESVRSADKGHAQLMAQVLAACRGERPFVPGIEAGYAAQSVALVALESIATGTALEVVLR